MYSECLNNLRSSITDSRVTGPSCFEEFNDIESETDRSGNHI